MTRPVDLAEPAEEVGLRLVLGRAVDAVRSSSAALRGPAASSASRLGLLGAGPSAYPLPIGGSPTIRGDLPAGDHEDARRRDEDHLAQRPRDRRRCSGKRVEPEISRTRAQPIRIAATRWADPLAQRPRGRCLVVGQAGADRRARKGEQHVGDPVDADHVCTPIVASPPRRR